jgi:tRNA A-37 threonylcarbamoyl transferase component Bud32
MPEASHETHFAEILAKGMASAEEVAEARRLLAEAAARGAELTVAEALMRAGVKAVRAHHVAAAPAADAATAAAEDTAAAAMPSSDLQVLEKLGRGSQAMVFKCRQISMDRIVAVKILLARSARDPAATERFLREARQAANLSHPNIVTVHQIMPFTARSSSGAEPIDTFCIVMEYIDGGTVAELLAARKRFDHAEAACIIRPVAEALSYAHKRGIIHRDIKPGNILLTEGGLVKLADLGLAMPLTAAQQAGQAGFAYGTPYYIAPEQVRGDADIDFRADLYSLAATFYEMVAGVPPFTAATPQEVMRKHLTELPPDPRQHVPELSGAMCWMLSRALAKDREYRYESADDFIGALEKLFPTVDATVAGPIASGKTGPEQGRKVVLPDDDASSVVAPVADPTVPASQALVQQIASVAGADRRRNGRTHVAAERAGAKPGAPARAAGAKIGLPAARAARDPQRARWRNTLLVGAFGGLVVIVVLAVVLLFVLAPPGKKVEAPPKFGAKFAVPSSSEPAAVAPGPAPKVGGTFEAGKPALAENNAGHTPDAPAAPVAPAVVSPAPPKEEKPPEPPSEPPKEENLAEPASADPAVITARADTAKPHGPKGDKGIRYEKIGTPGAPNYRDNIGLWRSKDEYVTWDVTIPQPGTYEVEITYAAPARTGGEYTVEVVGKKLKAKTEDTGGWEKFAPRTIGTLKINKAGHATITVRPVASPKGGGLMNLQALTLRRTGA